MRDGDIGTSTAPRASEQTAANEQRRIGESLSAVAGDALRTIEADTGIGGRAAERPAAALVAPARWWSA